MRAPKPKGSQEESIGQNYSNAIESASYDDLESAILRNNPSVDCVLVRKAYNYAIQIHAGQKRDEGSPYFLHPFRVALYMAREMQIGDEKIIATALLHDTIEDGKDVNRSALEKEFGKDVAYNVSILSKPKVPEAEKEEMLKEYFERIRNAPIDIIKVKIADRVDNIRSLHLSPKKRKINRYVKETKEIFLPLAMKHFPAAALEMGEIVRKFEEKGFESF